MGRPVIRPNDGVFLTVRQRCFQHHLGPEQGFTGMASHGGYRTAADQKAATVVEELRELGLMIRRAMSSRSTAEMVPLGLKGKMPEVRRG